MIERSCPACGEPVTQTARFCVHCGAALPEPVPAWTATPGAFAPEVDVPPATVGVPWRALDALWVFLIHLLVTAVLAVPTVAFIADADTRTAVVVLLSEAALLGTTLTWLAVRYRVGPRGIGLRGFTWPNVGIGIGAGAGGLLAASIVTVIIAGLVEALTNHSIQQPDQIPLDNRHPHGLILWVLGVSVVVFAPLAEEVFFRGLLYSGIRRWARAWPAVLLSAGIFAGSHLIPLVIPPIFALGVMLAWLVEWRRSIVPSIFAHMSFNAVGFYASFVAVHGFRF